MKFPSAKAFMDWPAKAVTIFGMSGVGKTSLARMLRHHDWFHFSVDYRIGTRYMGEHIVDNFKKEAMKNPFLRDLLRTDSIYISSNITFENLDPLSTYLGKPGNPDKGGISFDAYRERLEQHRQAEIASLHDVPLFVKKAREIYGYQHFICDSGGSLCEVVDAADDDDPVLRTLAAHTLLLYIRGTPEHAEELIERFRYQPKPMYYQPGFLKRKWAEYKAVTSISADDDVDPDDFLVWGFGQLLHHRIPLYEAIARQYGYAVDMQRIPEIGDQEAFLDMICEVLDEP